VKVCIESQPDGSFSVYVESAAGTQPPQGADASGMGAAPAGGAQPAKSVDEALAIARSMLGGGGQEQQAQDDQSADALFQGGFDSARSPLNRG
jgi:hypothetical protein